MNPAGMASKEKLAICIGTSVGPPSDIGLLRSFRVRKAFNSECCSVIV